MAEMKVAAARAAAVSEKTSHTYHDHLVIERHADALRFVGANTRGQVVVAGCELEGQKPGDPVAVHGARFVAALGACPGEAELAFDVKGRKLVVASGRRRAVLPILTASEVDPTVFRGSTATAKYTCTVTVPGNSVVRILKGVLPAIDPVGGMRFGEQASVTFAPGWIEACGASNTSMAISRVEGTGWVGGPRRATFSTQPAKAILGLVERADMVALDVAIGPDGNPSTLRVRAGGDEVVVQAMSDPFFDYRGLLANVVRSQTVAGLKHRVRVMRLALLDMVRAAKAYSPRVEFSLAGGYLCALAEGAELGRFDDSIDAEILSPDSERFTFALHANVISAAMECSAALAVVIATDGNDVPLIVVDEDQEATPLADLLGARIVMPMR